jgi:hypothetical protein
MDALIAPERPGVDSLPRGSRTRGTAWRFLKRRRAPTATRRIAVALLCLLLFNGSLGAEPLEVAVKAAYLVKFPFYVEWPPSSFTTPTSPIVICVVGEDPFGSTIDEAVSAQQAQGRPMSVKRIRSLSRDSGCHVAYVGGEGRFDWARAAMTLVVTDAPEGTGIINFVLRDNRVRFTVDDDAASQNGLSISSKLLSVALAVRSRGAK